MSKEEVLTALAAAYGRAFHSNDGQTVLKDLMMRFYDGPMTGPDLNRDAGRRDVLVHIRAMMTQNERSS